MKQRIAFLLTAVCVISGLQAQDYKDQLTLIRPKPGNCLIYGPITAQPGIPFNDATISLLNPLTHETIEKIRSDRQGWYLFSVEKGKRQALLIEKPGYFPYYHEFLISTDQETPSLEKPLLLPPDLRNIYSLYYVPMDTVAGPNSLLLINQLAGFLVRNPEVMVRLELMGDSLDPARVNQLTAKFMQSGIRSDRLTIGTGSDTLPTDLVVEIRTGSEDLATMVTGGEVRLPEDGWTIQFAASRGSLNKKSYNGLDPVYEFKGKDGFYRYTYGHYKTKEEAQQKLSFVRKKGFSRAFVKSVESIGKL